MNKCFEKKMEFWHWHYLKIKILWNNIHVHRYAWTEGGEYSYFWNIILTLKYTKYKHENQLNINTHIYEYTTNVDIIDYTTTFVG